MTPQVGRLDRVERPDDLAGRGIEGVEEAAAAGIESDEVAPSTRSPATSGWKLTAPRPSPVSFVSQR